MTTTTPPPALLPAAETPRTPTWWRNRLGKALLRRNTRSGQNLDYYHARYEHTTVEPRYRDAYRLLLEEAKSPWAQLVIDAITKRLKVHGIRTGTAGENEALWDTIQASHLDADQRLIYADAMITGYGYVSVWPTKPKEPNLAVESSFQVITEGAPGNRRAREAALKLWVDDITSTLRATLYLPDEIHRWHTTKPDPLTVDAFAELTWIGEDPEENPIGVVPIVPFQNRRDAFGEGHSEIRPLIPTLRRIDRLVLDKLLTAETAAFRQKWATGLSIPRDPETGNTTEPFSVALDKLWISDSADTTFGSFEATQLEPYIAAIEQEIAHLAAISRVPAHYLMQQNLVNPPSAESMLSAEAGLVAKVIDRQDTFGEAWEQVAVLAQAITGQGSTGRLEIQWKDPARKAESQIADTAIKLKEVGVPQEALWERVGASPVDIRRWRGQKAIEIFNQAITAPDGSVQAVTVAAQALATQEAAAAAEKAKTGEA